MTKRPKKYGWLFHEREGVWMPPDGAYFAEQEGKFWVLYRCESPYDVENGVLLAEEFSTLLEAVEAADEDR